MLPATELETSTLPVVKPAVTEVETSRQSKVTLPITRGKKREFRENAHPQSASWTFVPALVLSMRHLPSGKQHVFRYVHIMICSCKYAHASNDSPGTCELS